MFIPLLVHSDGQTPLHLSAIFGRLEVCRLLLQSGADVNAKAR
jgi:ankyrin repeat protein